MSFKSFVLESIKDLSGSQHDVDQALGFFILQSISAVAQTHIYHLLTKSYAEHIAIGEYYEALQGKTDKLAEQCIGLDLQFRDVSQHLLVFDYNKEQFVAEIKSYRDVVTDAISKTGSDALMSVNDTLISIQADVDALLYKLQLA